MVLRRVEMAAAHFGTCISKFAPGSPKLRTPLPAQRLLQVSDSACDLRAGHSSARRGSDQLRHLAKDRQRMQFSNIFEARLHSK